LRSVKHSIPQLSTREVVHTLGNEDGPAFSVDHNVTFFGEPFATIVHYFGQARRLVALTVSRHSMNRPVSLL